METNPLPAARPAATERPVPRWAGVAARAIPWVGLPLCLWRLPFAFGCTMGTVQDGTYAWWVTAPYVLALGALTECLALLCLGLVRGWGERVPARVPRIGGRRIPPAAVTAPAAAVGAGLLVLLVGWVRALLGHAENLTYTGTGWQVLGESCQALMLLWGPLLLAVTHAYWRRRRRPSTSSN
ncbi:hypothetical protein ACFV6F_26035 [Kitasatospora phosalacinea]|uniref:hypothetical protein n=1 Tax=Kitasatospora phosalacinea TaxID=2065 RepID=UPI003650B39E